MFTFLAIVICHLSPGLGQDAALQSKPGLIGISNILGRWESAKENSSVLLSAFNEPEQESKLVYLVWKKSKHPEIKPTTTDLPSYSAKELYAAAFGFIKLKLSKYWQPTSADLIGIHSMKLVIKDQPVMWVHFCEFKKPPRLAHTGDGERGTILIPLDDNGIVLAELSK